MKKLSLLAVSSAVALSVTPAFAESPVEPLASAAAAAQSGDAEVTLITQRSAAVAPGLVSWISLQWMDEVTDAREFRVTASAPGVSIGYPTNTADHSSLYWDDTLIPGEIDYTALQLTVDPTTVGPVMLDVTLSYVSDSGPTIVTHTVEVPVEAGASTGGLSYAGDTLGSLELGAEAWLDLALAAETDVSQVSVEVVDANGFGVSYPSEDTMSKPSNGSTMLDGATDVARMQFDSNDMAAGTYPVTLSVSYYVGSDLKTDTVVRNVIVGDGGPTTTTTIAPTTTVAPPTTAGPTTTVAPPTTAAPTTTVHVPSELFGPMTAAGWTVDPNGTDSATTGQFEVGTPGKTTWGNYTLQPGGTPSGNPALVTGALSGSNGGIHDIDGGATSALSSAIAIPADVSTSLEFEYFFAYLSNATSEDYLKVTVVGETGNLVVLDVRGASAHVGGVWTSVTADLSDFAGQDVRLLVEAADNGAPSLVEGGIADVSIFG